MKRVFGFLAGAAIGAGGFFGLRKVLRMMEPAEVAAPSAPSAPASPSRPSAPAVEASVSKAQIEPGSFSAETASKQVGADLLKAQEAMSKLEEMVSMLGEPAARHQEPVAAAESAPEATTPRSETAEKAVPENVEVKPADTTPARPKKAADATTAEPKRSRKSAKPAAASKPDDFTVILDVGPVFNKKLLDAGITTFKQLAALTPQQIEERTGISAERIEYGKWLQQVNKILADQTSK